MLTYSKNPPLWPFLVADAFFLGVGFFIFWQADRPLLWWEAGCLVLCAALGAGAFITPFLKRAANSTTLLQAQTLANTVEKIQKLDQLASQISNSTAQWQVVQDTSAKTVQTAKELSQSMAAEMADFTDFLQKANDTERTHLRLEADKLRRAETEWLQIVIRILDQVHALFQAAVQSGQPELSGQIGQFQNVCRDIPRRVGLTALTAQSGEPFDAKRHQLLKDAPSPENALIQDTLAPGYAYQGQLVRRVLVQLQEPPPVPPSA
jgi:molecular chaperone GrpE (heat shock protein)